MHKFFENWHKKRDEMIGLISNYFLFIKKQYLEKKFYKRLGYTLNFNEKPKTFNQKIQFRKVFDKNPLYALCSDKYRVREYVKEKIGEEYLIPLHLVTDKLIEEHWEKLPNQCVIKANHNSGPVQIILDKAKADKYKIINEINRQLKEKYGLISMESYYDDIKPMVTVEKFIGENGKIPEDYKFQCFKNNGDFKIFIQVDEGRYGRHCRNIYDEQWNLLDMKHESKYPHIDKFEKPKKFEEMKKIVKKLSEDFEYVRVDLFAVEEKIYFGELTFAHGSGFEDLNPLKWDEKWGSYWNQKITK